MASSSSDNGGPYGRGCNTFEPASDGGAYGGGGALSMLGDAAGGAFELAGDGIANGGGGALSTLGTLGRLGTFAERSTLGAFGARGERDALSNTGT